MLVALRKLVVRHRWYLVAACVTLLAVLSGLYWREQTARADLRSEYAALMREAIRQHYLIYSQLPTTSAEVAGGNPTFRNPDLVYRATKLEGDNFPNGSECFLDLEDRAFADVTPIPAATKNDWQATAAKLQEIIDLTPGIDDKLWLAVDTEIDFMIAIRHAASLETAGLVENQQLQDYLEAAAEYRRLLLNLPNEMQKELLRHRIISDVERASDSEIAAAASRFEEQVNLVSKALANL